MAWVGWVSLWPCILEQLKAWLTCAGFPMAKNLRAKLPKEDTLYIQDVNPAATERFMSTELDENVTVASSPRELAENAVCHPLSISHLS